MTECAETMLTDTECGVWARHFASISFAPCRRQCSVCRSWPHLPCSSSLCGMASSPHWSAAPLLANIWDSCCTSCSVLVTSPLLSTTKGMTYFCGSPLLTHPQIFLLCRTCGTLDKSVGSSIVLVIITFGRDGCEPSKDKKLDLT